ncbi:group II intron reverse transcriptase/maturase [Alkalibacillus flavidus]|uniref:RNA-directed DNA polymerase n=1 Tax=Alkalibacillus flavidus TaxID=546021 RepID=A0ABV2KXR4_9BACI
MMDRFIQQAIAQELTRVFDPGFSTFSYGFRPNKQGHEAVRQAQAYIKDGHRWVVDVDLEKFFDTVNHDKLMGVLAKKVKDKTVLKLINKYLKAGVMIHGVSTKSQVGTPQGGPLSPILANILLDELDKELETRGHKFVRYADDFQIYVKSRKAGQRVMTNITTFLEKTMKLKVNREKSAVDRPWKRKFLGFSFTLEKQTRTRIHKDSIKRFKSKVRELTSRKSSIPMDRRIERLNKFLNGWLGYYALADTKSIFKELDEWIRRRLRMCRWKEWKLSKTRVKNLKGLGVNPSKAYEWGNTRKGYWRIAHSPILHKSLGNSYWSNLGLTSLYGRYQTIRQS